MLIKINNIYINTDNIYFLTHYAKLQGLSPEIGIVVNETRIPIYRWLDPSDKEDMKRKVISIKAIIQEILYHFPEMKEIETLAHKNEILY